ncbi:hypothetical protein NVP1170O_191 [Vibrio phage 1.170.O._10N.261.52.C3]|nr:hypothetical protein NVP1170O_191 [Vibrio phage 1.170.O._10N.261.52.C3]
MDNVILAGEKVTNRKGQSATIVSIEGRRVTLLTDRGSMFITDRTAVYKGSFKVRDIPSVCGVGYIGYGKHKSKSEGKHTKAYVSWREMLRRCYDEKSLRFKDYGGRGVYVCKEWLDFQNFADWYVTQYQVFGVKYHLEKDFKSGKYYSPHTCMLLPHYLNMSILDGYKRETKGSTTKNGRHRVQISCLGYQYQLPDHCGEGSVDYHSYFKKELVIFISDLAYLLGHITQVSKTTIQNIMHEKLHTEPTENMFSVVTRIKCKIFKLSSTCKVLGLCKDGLKILESKYLNRDH